MKSVVKGNSLKKERELKVLLGLVELFLRDGKPIGSKTLMESGFESLSSSTIRNYFAELESEGYLHQAHTSGGRAPTAKAFRYYASEMLNASEISEENLSQLQKISSFESKEIANFLQKNAELLSDLTHHAVFLSAPRFDRDFIQEVKLVPIDLYRFLCVTISDFGVVQTELLHTSEKLSKHTIMRIESYFLSRLRDQKISESLTDEEEEIAKGYYNELMLRYIVGYTTFVDEEVYRTGFSRLLDFPDFEDPAVVASSLALFENSHSMRLLLKDCLSKNQLRVWVGDELKPFAPSSPDCSIVAIPYYINNQPVGAVGVLGPMRTAYKQIFGLLKAFSKEVSASLTKTIYKHKITFRQPDAKVPALDQSPQLLLENQNKDPND